MCMPCRRRPSFSGRGTTQEFYPYTLPEDYKSFLLISDGLLLKWHMRYQGTSVARSGGACAPRRVVASVRMVVR